MERKSALLIIDCQYDFFEKGALGVTDSLSIIPFINKLRKLPFDLCIFTQDSHPQGHVSFASSHKNIQPYTTISLQSGYQQEVWPDHCVQNTHGHEIHKDIDYNKFSDIVIQKGTLKEYDSYSGFGNDHEDTGLSKILQANKITKVYIVGLAYDFCVGNTAIDANNLGFEAYIIMDCTKPVSHKFAAQMDDKLKKIEKIHKIYYRELDQTASSC